MKTFTIAAALDAGVVKPDDRFDCMMGRMMVGKYTIHDTHPYGALTVAEVFKHSSNIGATKIARKLGRDGLADALERFGFGRPTGIGLPGERAGVRAAGRQVGRHRVRQRRVRPGADGHAAADGDRRVRDCRRRASTGSHES